MLTQPNNDIIAIDTRLQGYLSAEQQIISDVAWLPLYMRTQAYLLANGMPLLFSSQWSPWSTHDYCQSQEYC